VETGGDREDVAGRTVPGTRRPLDLLTFCVLVLRNGFTVTGESACASPENFDAEIGRKIARQNAVQKIWPLMGYELYGADGETNPITLTKAKVDAFRAIAYEGGSTDVLFRVGSNDIDADEIGKLCSKLHGEIRVRVEPPLPVAGAAEDNGAPLFEEPSDARLAAEAAFSDPGAEGMDPNAGFDATDAFVDAHAAD
jgi:hypothetical protein